MPSPRERTPREKETLIFATPQEAQEWRGRLAEAEQRPSIRSGLRKAKREVLQSAVADQFSKEGEEVEIVREPWLHTTQEHAEAQALVDLAFDRDLPAAIRKARTSPNYPRNLDLFHDVLTGEMYHLLQEQGLRRQPLAWGVVAFVLILGSIAAAIFMIWRI